MTKRLKVPLFGKRVKNATATRAVFQAGSDELDRVVVSIIDAEGNQLNFELTARQAATLIEQLMSAYNAIMPVLRTSRGGFGL